MRYFLRDPILPDQRLDQGPCGGFNPIPGFAASVQSKSMLLIGPIASQSAIPSQLSADRGLMNLDRLRNLRLIVSGFQKRIPKGIYRINLVSLFTGMLRVGSHQCSPDWLGQAFDLAGLRSTDAAAAYLLSRHAKLHL